MKGLFRISLILLLHLSSLLLYGNKAFFFTTHQEGIYKIQNPFSDTTAFIINEKNCYKPHYNILDNSFYIYGEEESVYQLIQKTDTPPFDKISNNSFISKKTIYKYSLENSIDLDHWLHCIVNSNEVYSESIFTGQNLKTALPDSLTIHFYNFFNKTSLEVKVNGIVHDLYFFEIGEHIVKLPYPIEEDNVLLDFFSPNNEIGIIKIGFNNFDKEISYKKPFSRYTYSKKNTIYFSKKKEFIYFSFIKGTLKQLSFPLHSDFSILNNILVQESDSIKTLNLTEIVETNELAVDYVILTNKDFSEGAISLKGILKTSLPDLKIEVIDVQEIYNKYSFSNKSAKAIKLFLHSVNPKFVLMVGDASSRQNSIENFLPTFFYKQNQKIRIASDYIYCYLDDPMDPKFALGRLPVRSNEELSIYIKKLEAYLEQENKNKNLIVDDENILAHGNRFGKNIYYKEQANTFWNKILNQFSNHFTKTINKTNPNVIYHIGHGSFSGWRKKDKIEFKDLDGLRDGLIFNLIDLSCWTGEYAHRNEDSFSEKLLRMENKGALSMISSSGFTLLKNYSFIMKYLNKNLNIGIGTTLNTLKKELYNLSQLSIDDMHAFNLLGIPSIKLNR